jgi:hypothetical protein
MSTRSRLAVTFATLLAPLIVTNTANAAAGDPCAGAICGLGGQIRAQIGDALPIPISIAPARTGPFSLEIGPLSGLAPVGKGYGQPGAIKPTPAATIMQTAGIGSAPRKLTIPEGAFQYGPVPQVSIGLFVDVGIFAVQTNIVFQSPHPGTTQFGNTIPGLGGSATLMAGGRPGPSTVSFCHGAPGTAGTNFMGACVTPGDGASINGLVRFTKTANQFGGMSRGRINGTAKVFFNKDGRTLGEMPCNGPTCQIQISTLSPNTARVDGADFGSLLATAAFQTPTGVYSGSVGFNGTIFSVGNAITVAGAGIPFTGRGALNVGFPLTTGMLTISVTNVLPGAPSEIFKRTGIDARDANGNGIVALNSGTMSIRSISKGNANRTWVTYEIPEPSAIISASATLFGLVGCHLLVRLRSR